ncbi:uridine kinase family protein [Propioniciclava flava]
MSRPGNVDAPGVRVGPGQWSGDDVAERIVALWGDAPPRCGATRVVAIDGLSGAGKTTLASLVAARLGAPVVHMDDLYPGWDGLAAGVAYLVDAVLRPLAVGEPARYRAWDWADERRGSRPVLGAAADVGAGRLWGQRGGGVVVCVGARVGRGAHRDPACARARA